MCNVMVLVSARAIALAMALTCGFRKDSRIAHDADG